MMYNVIIDALFLAGSILTSYNGNDSKANNLLLFMIAVNTSSLMIRVKRDL